MPEIVGVVEYVAEVAPEIVVQVVPSVETYQVYVVDPKATPLILVELVILIVLPTDTLGVVVDVVTVAFLLSVCSLATSVENLAAKVALDSAVAA